MKTILRLFLILSLLIITACDEGSSSPTGGDLNEVQVENLCKISFEGELADFNQDTFKQNLATEVGGDTSQIDIESVSQRGVLDVSFVFIDVEGFPSVNELLTVVQSITTVGNYSVTVIIENLSEPDLCTSSIDCHNLCGGSATVDECGVCDGDGPENNFNCDGDCIAGIDCNDECGGSATIDECGVCGGNGGVSTYVEECNWEYICEYVNISLGAESYCSNSCINGDQCFSNSDCYYSGGFANMGCNNGATCVMWQQELQCGNQYICEGEYITECP